MSPHLQATLYGCLLLAGAHLANAYPRDARALPLHNVSSYLRQTEDVTILHNPSAFYQQTSWSLLARASEPDFDPEDQSFIRNMAAVGDSYSAGIGAGNRIDYWCSRYDGAYPVVVNTDQRLGDPANRQFQFLSCSGGLNADTISQLSMLNDQSQDVILISSSGNDVGFSNILNACVFKWDPQGHGGNDDCIIALSNSLDVILSDNFPQALDQVVNAAKAKLASSGTIYWTGYPRFWGEDDRQCDDQDWTFWYSYRVPLILENRRKMNLLTDSLNNAIQSAVTRGGDSVVWVPYSQYVEGQRGRFCEVGYNELDSNRWGLDIYNWYTNDAVPENFGPDSVGTLTVSNDPVMNGTFAWQINEFARNAKAANSSLTPRGTFQQSPPSSDIPSTPPPDGRGSTQAVLPDSYGRIFHPRLGTHELVASLVLYKMMVRRATLNGVEAAAEMVTADTCPAGGSGTPTSPNSGTATPNSSPTIAPGQSISSGVPLRILPLGDSITFGFRSTDGNGYRLDLLNLLSGDQVVFAGTRCSGNMQDHWNEGYSAQTIETIAANMGNALQQGPNIILLHAGTNNLLPDNSDPNQAAQALATMIDQIIAARPDAVLLVAQIINVDDSQGHEDRTLAFNKLVPGIVQQRFNGGKKILYVDFSSVGTSDLYAGDVHPTDQGYNHMAQIWDTALRGLPAGWVVNAPQPNYPINPANGFDCDPNGANGGLDQNIPPPNFPPSAISPTSKAAIAQAARDASDGGRVSCNGAPVWDPTGEMAYGLGRTGDFIFHKNWVHAGNIASGLGLSPSNVHLVDMTGDGKADYLWVNPENGQLVCWLNNQPNPWSPAGTNSGIIASGSAAWTGAQVFFADMNGDGKADYLIVDGETGRVDVYWNEGPDDSADNGWRFNPGGTIATGVPHANLQTLRFPDINGDGRADYVYIGENGALGAWLNEGQPGSYNVLFVAQGGIATGASADIDRILLQDIDGDGRADYLIWDDDAGLSGFLNQRTQRDGLPLYVYQGGAKTIADGVGTDYRNVRLADIDGDGKPDYCIIDANGGIDLWYNRGTADTSYAMDGLRLADMDGDGRDDYVWLEPASGQPTLYINAGPSDGDSLGWQFYPADPPVIAAGAGPAPLVHLADIDGDGKADYLVVDAQTGATQLYLNGGRDTTADNNWRFNPIGQIATGLGPGKNVRFADIDGDGKAEYIYLGPHGETTVYRNRYRGPDALDSEFEFLPAAGAIGIGQRPEEISFYDVNGDGRADYVWTRRIDGVAYVWLNSKPKSFIFWHSEEANLRLRLDYGNDPAWLPPSGPAIDVPTAPGISGQNIRWSDLLGTGRASYIAVDHLTGALSAWLNGCNDQGSTPCRAPQENGDRQFYYWEEMTNPKSGVDVHSVGFTAVPTWNSDQGHVETQAVYASSDNTHDLNSYYNGGAATSFQVNGTTNTGFSECDQNGFIKFTKSCDGQTYNAVGVNGTRASCRPPDSSVTFTIGSSGRDTTWTAKLLCTGQIC